MKTYKPTYRDRKTGKKKKCSHYYLTFVDNRQIRRRLPVYSDKSATDNLGIWIQKLLDSNGVLDRELQGWFTGLVPKVRDKLVEFNMVNNQRMLKNLDKTLAEHLQDFHESLLVKENKKQYAKSVKSTLESIFANCGFLLLSDIDGNTLYSYLGKRRKNDKISQRTFNCYLGFAQHFCGWLVKENRTTINPLEHLSPQTETEKKTRRAISLEQLVQLLDTTWAAPERFGMSGPERFLLYVLACQTGMRAGDLRALKVGSFDLVNLSVKIPASYSKNKKDKTLPLKPNTAAMLKDFFMGKLPNVKAFGGTYNRLTDRTAAMLRADLADANIDYVVDGKVFDFHALRKQAGTLLKQGGVHMKDAQTILRHSTIELTSNIYTEVFSSDEVDAVAKLPDLTAGKHKRVGA